MGLYVKELLAMGEKQLRDADIADAARDTRTIYCHIMNIPESRLVLEYQNNIQEYLCERFFDMIDTRASGMPLQYMLGTQEFMGLPFKVDERVLIPRQDTETLTEDAISLLTDGTLRGEVVGKPGLGKAVLDLCCGSGAIGISIAKLLSASDETLGSTGGARVNVNVTCSDVSEDAIALARENAAANGVTKEVTFAAGDLFQPFRKRFGKTKKFDLIVSNPPYIPTDVIATLQREIKEHEPLLALDGGADGLDFYRRIVAEAPEFLNPGGVLLMEIGAEQGQALKDMLLVDGRYKEGGRLPDLAGLDRVIYARID